MQVPELLDRIGAKVVRVGRVILQADPASDLAEELEYLHGEYARQDDRLATLRGQVALLMQKLDDSEVIAGELPAAVESSFRRKKPAQALRQALELESLRRTMDDDRAALKRLTHAVWCLEFRLRQLTRRIEHLGEELTAR